MIFDERSFFRKIVLLDGTVVEGLFNVIRAVGTLAHASMLFVEDQNERTLYPMSAVLRLER